MSAAPLAIAAAGAGRMGRGIALAFAWGGYEVALIDLKPRDTTASERLQREAMDEMAATLAMLAELGAMTDETVERVLSRIRVVPEALAAQALGAADVVFECGGACSGLGVGDRAVREVGVFGQVFLVNGDHAIVFIGCLEGNVLYFK